jgi:hypothetical protein
MTQFAPLGPRRPIRRPKPIEIECTNGNYIYQDATSNFQAGDEVFVCTEENIPEYALLETGSYSLENGGDFSIIDGILQ